MVVVQRKLERRVGDVGSPEEFAARKGFGTPRTSQYRRGKIGSPFVFEKLYRMNSAAAM